MNDWEYWRGLAVEAVEEGANGGVIAVGGFEEGVGVDLVVHAAAVAVAGADGAGAGQFAEAIMGCYKRPPGGIHP